MEGSKTGWIWGIVVLVIVLAGGWYFLTNKSGGAASETGPIKIGFIGPLTGDGTAIGTASMNAFQLAVADINDKGGINGRQLEVVYEDGKCNAGAALGAANKLINADHVSVIAGAACSTETSAFAPSAMQAKIPVLSYCSSAPTLSKTGKYFFRNYPSDAYQGKFAANYLYNTLKARKVAVLYHISDYGTGIKDVFEQEFKTLGGEIVAEEGTVQTATDYRTQLSKIKSANPDYIFSATYPQGGTAMLKQAKELAIKTKFLGSDAWGDNKLWADVSGLGEDLLYTNPKVNSSDDFRTKLLAKTGGKEIPLCAPQAYDAAYILAGALKSSGTDPDKFADALRATKYDGVSGHIEFDQNGDLVGASYVVMRIANDTATEVK